MKHLITTLGASLMAMTTVAMAANPKAPEAAIVNAGNARFTVLTPEMIRIEYSDSSKFEDRATFAIINRELSEVPDFMTGEDDNYIYITTDKLKLKYRKGADLKKSPTPDDLSIVMSLNGEEVEWYPGKEDPLNLKGTTRTLDRSNGDNKRSEMEDGIISRSGWAVIDDSWSHTRQDGSRSFALEPNEAMGYDWWAPRADEGALDLYFLGYGHDYKKALADFTAVAGKIPLPPDYVFGYWYSKYDSYSDEDFRGIMRDIADNDIPADVMILDMDWHWNGNPESDGRGGWTGWSWNTNLIPDAPALLDEMHEKKFKTALNLHPADGIARSESPEYFAMMEGDLSGKYTSGDTIKWSIDYPDFTESFFKNIIHPHEGEGVDFWWLDWQQHLTSHETPGLGETFWTNHVFFNDMAANRKDRRPLIFHRWGGLGSHRYQIGFSGDAFINYPTLAFQPYFTSTSSNVGYTYWGHDLGGHMISDEALANDPELVLRWLQFGVFTPIFRTHATKDPRLERRVWKFDNFPDIQKAIRLRYTIFPYLYTMARKTYDTGLGIVRPLYYEYPEIEEAYNHEDQYFFGDDIIVAPIVEASKDGKTSTRTLWLPEGNWWSASTSRPVKGGGEVTLNFGMDQIPYFYKEGAIIPLNPPTVMNMTERPDRMVLDVVAGADGEATLYEDKGDNSDYADSFAVTSFEHKSGKGVETITIYPRTGDAAGLAAAKAWTVNLLNSAKPKSVAVDGKVLPKSSWSYDKNSLTAKIDVPKTDCETKVEIQVSF